MYNDTSAGKEDLEEPDETENLREVTVAVVPEDDFEKANYDFETVEFQKIQPLHQDDLDHTAIELREGGVITLQDSVQLFLYK